nr:MAG TPA: hypothetical protein [Bacteriophage sp.]
MFSFVASTMFLLRVTKLKPLTELFSLAYWMRSSLSS